MEKKGQLKKGRVALFILLVLVIFIAIMAINSSTEKENTILETVTTKDTIAPAIKLTGGERIVIAKRRKVHFKCYSY